MNLFGTLASQRSVPPSTVVRPFLKWLGGKTLLFPQIEPLLRPGTRLIEPFAGSGTVSLNASHAGCFERFLLADINADLINVFSQLQAHNGQFIGEAKALFTPHANSATVYYERREEFNHTESPFRKACLFVYLNRHGFNGLCRYNSSGAFNVPFGKYVHIHFPEQEMRTFYCMLQRCELRCAGFAEVLRGAGPDDTVYCDPPYIPLSDTSAFTAYAAGGFGTEDQANLLREIESAAQRGARVVVSNHDTPVSRELYRGATALQSLPVRRSVSSRGASRGSVMELLAVYEPPAAELVGGCHRPFSDKRQTINTNSTKAEKGLELAGR